MTWYSEEVFRVLCQGPWLSPSSSSEACVSTTTVGTLHCLRWFLKVQPSHLLFQGRKEGPAPCEISTPCLLHPIGLDWLTCKVPISGHTWSWKTWFSAWRVSCISVFPISFPSPLYTAILDSSQTSFLIGPPFVLLSMCALGILYLKSRILYMFLFLCILLVCFWLQISDWWIM